MNFRFFSGIAAAAATCAALAGAPNLDSFFNTAAAFETPDVPLFAPIAEFERAKPFLFPSALRLARARSAERKEKWTHINTFSSALGHNSNVVRKLERDEAAFAELKWENVHAIKRGENSIDFAGTADLFGYEHGDRDFNTQEYQLNVSVERPLHRLLRLKNNVRLDSLRLDDRDFNRYARWTGDILHASVDRWTVGVEALGEMRDARIEPNDPRANRDATRTSLGPFLALPIPTQSGAKMTFCRQSDLRAR